MAIALARALAKRPIPRGRHQLAAPRHVAAASLRERRQRRVHVLIANIGHKRRHWIRMFHRLYELARCLPERAGWERLDEEMAKIHGYI